LTTPEIVCPSPETLKVGRSPSHRSLQAPALPGSCPTREAGFDAASSLAAAELVWDAD
jgi:hypothetical protein